MRESEIRPEALLKKYFELCVYDTELFFGNDQRVKCRCVACGSTKTKKEFIKFGFGYVSCLQCQSLFQSPRPLPKSFENFYRNSSSSNYWAEVFFPSVAEARREKIFKPRVSSLFDIVSNRGYKIKSLIDVGAGFGMFIEEWRKLDDQTNCLAIEPSQSLAAVCRQKGIQTLEDVIENVEGYENFSGLVVSFEVLEHVWDPVTFLKGLVRMTKPGGIVFVSTLSIDGFDLQHLWGSSKQISPPHHLNFLSNKGLEELFEKAGLINIELTTPGKLDVDIVVNACKEDRALIKSNRFIKKLIDKPEIRDDFQQYLVKNKMSSHVWIVGQRPVISDED